MMITDEIKNNKKNILIYLLVILVSILLKHFAIYTGLVVFIFVLLLNKNNLFFKILSFFLVTILTSEIIYLLYYHQRITQAILDSIVETNYLELSKMMSSNNTIFLILTSVIIAICVSFTGIYNRQSKYFKHIKMIISVAMVTLIATDINKFIFKHRLLSDIQEDNKTLGRVFYDKYPLIIGDIAYMVTSITSNEKYRHYEENIKNNKAITGQDKNISAENIIIIMGESSSSYRYSAYGYTINTTPNMKNIFSQNGGCIIRNAHSSAPITRDSVAMTFSFATPESEEPLFKEKNIIDLAKENGYKTYWLSSQEISGLYASKFGYIAKKSDVIKLTKGKDDKLNNLLFKALQNTGKKFIVLHLSGSHLDYTNFDDLDKKALPMALIMT